MSGAFILKSLRLLELLQMARSDYITNLFQDPSLTEFVYKVKDFGLRRI